MWLTGDVAWQFNIDREQLLKQDSREQFYSLVDWFRSAYFDPARDGFSVKHRWLPIGPLDPFDELLTVFGDDIPRSILVEAAAELSNMSGNWHALPDEATNKRDRSPAHSFRADDTAGMRRRIETEEFRTEVLTKIALLEGAIAQLEIPTASYSHNCPPGPLTDIPANKADIADLSEAIAALRAEALSIRPNATELTKQSSKLLDFSKKIIGWSGAKADKFVDAAFETAGKAAGAAFILGVVGLLPHIADVAAAVEKLAEALS